ncbi:MAG: NAD-dependent epimerase/dehydratase family protein [Acidimicrobiaceae bacterium]|jgi:nucleoside-diphosphate-sugar epimerase|nr:NAD-dependent epimerase/dehydratase family protein [Acidimicrobiaceae bacterium]
MSTILVTGASGFIGRRLVQALQKEGRPVVAVVSPLSRSRSLSDPALVGARIVTTDMRDSTSLEVMIRHEAPDTIVNLAVARSSDAAESWAVNHAAVGAILAVASELGLHVLQIGSSAEYGPLDSDFVPSESQRPVGLHGESKYAASQLVSSSVLSATVEAATLRPFLVYGPDEPRHRLIPQVIAAVRSGDPIRLTAETFGRDYVYVDDVVDAIVAAVRERIVASSPIDLCTGVSTTNQEVVALVEQLAGVLIPRLSEAFPARPWDRIVWAGDPGPLTSLIDRPPVSLAAGLAVTLAVHGLVNE